MRCHLTVDALASMMRTTVDIDPQLLEQLRLESVRRGVSVKALLNAVIRSGLASRVAETRPQYAVRTASMGAPRVDLTHALRLAGALEDEEVLRKMEQRK